MSVDPKPFRASIRKLIDDGQLPLHNGQTALSLCDFAEQHGRHLADPQQVVTFMGLGEVTAVFAEPVDGERGNWYFVGSVLEATGANWQQWEQLRDEEIAEAAKEPAVPPRVDSITSYEEDGSTHQLPVCNWQMALLLALDGPWGKELMANVRPAFRKAAIASGIADQIPVVRIAEDGAAHDTGETMADVFLGDGPLPSDEVIREQIQRGPLGALEIGGDR
ncbi:hypothetical protein HW846_46550 [Streptomyces sp. NE06-02F]|uniref:hypothetical protein n=1 Tax=Streptomyces caniscabiei TaxID=2746961 RepID=UPI001872733E|nr:hypothetical protein [Streptomyces caniscabiei]MBE4790708.1 hypothetical protein [Streptomyces caniscabiei]MDX2947904.1 hypothetical protein [Streptomyces caniscabiei]